MFLLDDLFLAPLKGLATICQKVHDAAEQEMDEREQALLREISELYRLLETRDIDEMEFDHRETVLLNQLDAIRNRKGGAGRNNR